MLFQTLDNKKECYAVFCNDALYHYPNSLDLTHTWSYTPHFKDKKLEYEVCPPHLKQSWEDANLKARAYLIALDQAKINLDDICFYDSVPKKFLREFYSLKNEITDWTFDHYKKPNNYDFMLELVTLLDRIRNQKLNLRVENLDFINPKVRNSFSKIKNSSGYISYNPWGTATGRLTTNQESFPILTLNRELRNVLTPNNDLFVELDYNSAELRTFLGLLGKDQPKEDLHIWIQKHIFNDRFTREETKKKVFAWLYNPKASNKKLGESFNRQALLDKYYTNEQISTPYGRCIDVEEDKALNYAIQSTASDLFLTSMLKIDKILQNKKSFVAFSIHDSLIIDFDASEKDLILQIVEKFSETKFGDFKTNLSIGRNFGDMRKIV